MKIRTLKIDITPAIGVELCGFANRKQPSTRILDPLYCKILLIGEGEKTFALIQFDLIGLNTSYSDSLRQTLSLNLDIPTSRIQLFSSHTHSGPCTLSLNGCGQYDHEYLVNLSEIVSTGCKKLLSDGSNLDRCTSSWHEGKLELGINRRKKYLVTNAYDLNVLSFQKENGDYSALLVNYAMHPVCLKTQDISSDYPGTLCHELQAKLPGNPLVLFGMGACGDIDPPEVGVSYETMKSWASDMSQSVIDLLKNSKNRSSENISDEKIHFQRSNITWPTESLDIDAIEKEYRERIQDKSNRKEFGPNYLSTLKKWKSSRIKEIQNNNPASLEIRIEEIDLGNLKLLFINAELFSSFTKLVKKQVSAHTESSDNQKFCIITCANGSVGYLPDKEQYSIGGYEVESSHIFYNTPKMTPGALEELAKLTINDNFHP